jgi:hypothetical protein
MPLNSLTAEERDIVRRSLTAAAVTRVDVAGVLRRWPRVDDTDGVVRLAINNALVNLLGYPHGRAAQLERELGVTTARLEEVFAKWRR